MIIEKIFPINYYNELSGLITDSSIAQIILRKNFPLIYHFLEPAGGIIYLNNTVNKWLLTIFIHRIPEIYSDFIWDLFLLEGNIVIFKALYAMTRILQRYILKSKTFDDLNNYLNYGLLNIKVREILAYYLLSKKYNFNMDLIKQYRKKLSENVIKEVNGIGDFHRSEKKKPKKGKKTTCDLKRPLCIFNPKNLNETYDKIILKQLNKPEIIEDYAVNYKKYHNDKINDENKEEKFEDLLIERRIHKCKLQENLDNDNIIKDESIKIDFDDKSSDRNENSSNNLLDLTTSFNGIITHEFDKIVTGVAKENEKDLNFIKEKEEDNISFDDKI